MSKTFNMYCDESTHLKSDGCPYMIISYVSVAYNQLSVHKRHFKMLKADHKFKGEVKWSKVSNGQYQFYSDLIDYFFSNDLKFRAIIVDKSKIDEGREEFTYDDFYFRMYYQLLHHKIDLEQSYNIYIDAKDTVSNRNLTKLKQILKYNASIRDFQFIQSYESSFMQLTDLLMGAINYKLRGLNAVLAKTRLIDKIELHCKLPITCSTPKSEDKFNLFYIDLK
ncbi:DUF3800 domain-containing protein [Olivibacter sp. CPCC 100613]|uniref:DUF3800 domain-containing protein n=1 Tax=Olivibacter sp. CPCC 100613 TaxID=3079931 RepID=UPI002FFD2B3B